MGLLKKWSALLAFTSFISTFSSSVRSQTSFRPWLKVHLEVAMDGADAAAGEWGRGRKNTVKGEKRVRRYQQFDSSR